MTSDTETGQDKLVTALLQMAQAKPSAALPITAIILSTFALGVSGVTAYSALGNRYDSPTTMAQSFAPAAQQPVATTSVTQTPQIAPTVQAEIAPPAAPAAASGATGRNVKIAQSTNGSIYAFDPDTNLAFRFDAGGAGPTPIALTEIPTDIQAQFASSQPAPGSSVGSPAIDMAALDAQSAQARAALAAQSTDQRRPPINSLLSTPEITSQIVVSLDQAQGVTVPAAGVVDEPPVIYAFFDPQCPYCHQAYEGLTGRFTVKWMPLSVLGPRGDRLLVHILGDVDVVETTVDGQQLNSAPLSEDAERAARLDRIMTSQAPVPEAELSEGQRFILDENAELFRLMSQGAEELRAVPSFFIRGKDGEAVWLRGFDAATPDMIADIVDGRDG